MKVTGTRFQSKLMILSQCFYHKMCLQSHCYKNEFSKSSRFIFSTLTNKSIIFIHTGNLIRKNGININFVRDEYACVKIVVFYVNLHIY